MFNVTVLEVTPGTVALAVALADRVRVSAVPSIAVIVVLAGMPAPTIV